MGLRWVLGVMLLASQLGCLGFFEEPLSLETKTNNPPWIDETSMNPSTNYVVIEKTDKPDGITTFFLGRALDFDGGDELWGYWLLVSQSGVANSLICGKAQEPSPQDFDPFKLRDVNFKCSVSHSRPQLEIDKDVVLELYIVDRDVPFEDINTGSPKWPAGNHFASVKWILQVR